MHDQNVEFGIGGNRVAQLFDGAVSQVVTTIPLTADFVGECVVAGVDLPADRASDEVDHCGGGWGDDAGQDGVIGLLLRREREWVVGGYVGVVDGAELALFAPCFAEIGAGFEASAGVLDERRVEAGEFGNAFDDAWGGFRIGCGL